MKKSIFTAMAFIAINSIICQSFAQETTKVRPGYNVKANVKARVIQTDNGCTIVFESSAPSPEVSSGTALSKKGYDYYQAQSSFSVSALDNSVTEITSPRDAANGMASGKRMHKPVAVTNESPVSASTSGISSDASAAKGSGGGAGKANFQDFSFTKRCGGKTTKLSVVDGECLIPTDSCPNGACTITADWSWGMSQSGSSKRCSVDFLLDIQDGVCHAINTKGTGATRDK